MPKKKYGAITVKASENRKLYDKLRYQIAIKPKFKPKGRTGVMKLRCPLCSHLINYQKFLERIPNPRIDVKMFWYGGRANIQIQNFGRIEPQIYNFIRETMSHKLKSLLIAFGEELEPIQMIAITKTYYFEPENTLTYSPEIEQKIPIKIIKEVSL